MDNGFYMKRCIELAEQGIGYAAPNPMVGCVIVENGEIIGEGYHKEYGAAHAEVNAVAAVKDKSRLQNAAVYVNLEPCSHHGKTPPCADLLIEHRVKKVVVGGVDSNPLVGGKGIEKLRHAGIEVITGVLEKECRELNKRFFTFHEKNRPYIILKWAQTSDGFISKSPVPKKREDNLVSGEDAQWMTHVWRSHEQGIMVGTNTVKADDPELNVRLVEGKSPVKIVLDRRMELSGSRVFGGDAKLIIFTEKIYQDDYSGPRKQSVEYKGRLEWIVVDFEARLIQSVLRELYRRNFLSILVEGGARLLQSFIDENLFDEIRVFTSQKKFGKGIKAPEFALDVSKEIKVGDDLLKIYLPE